MIPFTRSEAKNTSWRLLTIYLDFRAASGWHWECLPFSQFSLSYTSVRMRRGLADELLQSSDDLTRIVRSYVITGNPIYKQHFQNILYIRDGKMSRPVNYHDIYWDLVLADGPHPDLSLIHI